MRKIELKQWHTENLVFNKQFYISFAQCTPDRNLSWAEILRITTDAAGEDFTDRDMPWTFLQEKGIVIIVSRVSFHVYKMPKYDSIITLKTYEAAPMGPLCTRMFELYDAETNELLIKGLSLWTCLDFINKKLMPAKAFPYRPCPTNIAEFEGIKAGKISIPENMKTIAKHIIQYSELDANGHTNNSKYINFAIDNLPKEFQKKQIKDLRLNYSKEALLGEELEIKAAYNPEENKYTIQGLVNSEASFECELYY